jgi:hypothetical protein
VFVQKNRENNLGDTKPNQRVSDLLFESERAIRDGNSQSAYELSLQATQAAPENIDAWLLRATLAGSLEERIICVNRLNELAPNFQDRHNVAFFALKEVLAQDPFLAYLEETGEFYRAINGDHVLNIPKKRAPIDPFPPEKPHSSPLKAAYRLLTVAILGLLLAGIGTVVFAPLAAVAAIRAPTRSRAEQIGSLIVFIVSLLLFLLGLFFSILFVLHWLG